MPQFARSLDVYQGFNFKKDKQTPVGYITSLKMGGIALAADQATIKDPEQPDKTIADKVVGVLNHYMWETGTTDAMYMSAQISTENKQTLAAALLGSWSNIEVEIKYVVYEYDPKLKKYYKSNSVDAVLKGLLEKNGDELNLSVADDPSSEVQSPKNFTLQIGVKPQSLEQTVNLATASGKNLVKQWGITEGA
ncbi:hypothetical protein D187_008248 [Cystobacter fuscus DSM 2262]|jgi:hypothetical protein|uniref:Uncharacterized protein n=1 Tax=Cystobacter fuscus (strain ATCC 25194 / DSM 2262 / NBRC 100088 / M29) TaxID=1242864 RepID=S9QHR7_CYSF2|nr:hypothetical protein [Cystobacter fuscus]EPX55993.1 hypothetical protein D187_008248 [Cystobacter fuscus DSM 2262]WNG27244.1 hypothetical protein F0U62_26920 [Cystobacter fuscus]